MGGWPAGQGAAPGEGLGGLKQSGSQRQEATEAWQAWECQAPCSGHWKKMGGNGGRWKVSEHGGLETSNPVEKGVSNSNIRIFPL